MFYFGPASFRAGNSLASPDGTTAETCFVRCNTLDSYARSAGLRTDRRFENGCGGCRVEHRIIPCVGNPIEQDHRGIKQRYYPTLGFKALEAAAAFCRVYDEVRNYFRPRQKMGQAVSLGRRRELFIGKILQVARSVLCDGMRTPESAARFDPLAPLLQNRVLTDSQMVASHRRPIHCRGGAPNTG